MVENFFKTNKIYSMTLNPIDRYQYFGHDQRFRKFKAKCFEFLLNLRASYELIIECSEPCQFHTQGYNGPRLHLHGIITFRSLNALAHFLLTEYYSLLRWTSVDLDTCQDPGKWYTYCIKQKIWRHRTLTNCDDMFASVVSEISDQNICEADERVVDPPRDRQVTICEAND